MARLRTILLLVLVLLQPACRRADAYSLLTHEQLIDLTWRDSIVPLLLSYYPALTPAELEQARAYAYGGCVIQDIGYYPFGDEAFSNLTHYVRSGDFVINLFRNAQNANELAFAAGALSHYLGDTIGHSVATNRAVAIEFPKLRKKYGPVVSYAEGKHQHVQTEFAFDIDEVAQHRVAPIRYLKHVGLRVPRHQLALAYYQTYGLTETFSIAKGRRFNIAGYRFAVRAFIPRIAYAVTLLHRGGEPREPVSPEIAEIEKETATIAAENNWALYRHKAGIGTYALAGLLFVLPRIGPLKLVAVKGPTDATEADYMHSVALSISAMRQMVARFTPPAPAAGDPAAESHTGPSDPNALPADAATVTDRINPMWVPRHPLPNRDLDTGEVVQPGGYPLTDATYARLLHRLTRHPLQPIPPGIKEDILAYYAHPDLPITTKKNREQWAQVQADLVKLGNMPTSTEPAPYPTYGEDVDGAQ
ncbi:MAG: zinc dependent phospholipase C family protein [Acidobacteriota bacterium]|nr:zinc dependent phospholipase C family protein [Acidobacteriota bacterium]